MKFAQAKIEVTVNFAVLGLTETALDDLAGVIGEGMAALVERQKTSGPVAQKEITRRREVGEEFLRNLSDVKSAIRNVNNQPGAA